nr:Capsule polysaccharide export inner-membrane protein [Kibdelosporangium sp. MJ126-NF4]
MIFGRSPPRHETPEGFSRRPISSTGGPAQKPSARQVPADRPLNPRGRLLAESSTGPSIRRAPASVKPAPDAPQSVANLSAEPPDPARLAPQKAPGSPSTGRAPQPPRGERPRVSVAPLGWSHPPAEKESDTPPRPVGPGAIGPAPPVRPYFSASGRGWTIPPRQKSSRARAPSAPPGRPGRPASAALRPDSANRSYPQVWILEKPASNRPDGRVIHSIDHDRQWLRRAAAARCGADPQRPGSLGEVGPEQGKRQIGLRTSVARPGDRPLPSRTGDHRPAPRVSVALTCGEPIIFGARARGRAGSGSRTFLGLWRVVHRPRNMSGGPREGLRHHPTERFPSLLAIHTPWAWIDPHLGMSLWTTGTSCGRTAAGRELYTADRVYPPITCRGLPQSDAALDLGGHRVSTQPTGLISVTVFHLFKESTEQKQGPWMVEDNWPATKAAESGPG